LAIVASDAHEVEGMTHSDSAVIATADLVID